MLGLIPLPYKILLSLATVFVMMGSSFYAGLSYKEKEHQLALDIAIQQKLEAEKKASLITQETVEKVVFKDRIIVKEGAKVVEYIDRYVTQIDQNCTLSPEAVEALNKAAR